MKKTHIAVININAHGHINPTLAIVSELVKRGCRVTYPTTEEFLPAIKESGAVPLLYHSSLDSVKLKEAVNVPLVILDEGLTVFSQLKQLYKDDLPDLILFDFMALAGKLFAAKYGIEAVRLFTSYAANEHFSVISSLLNEQMMREVESKLKAFTEKERILGLSAKDLLAPEKLNISFLPRVFQPKGDTFDERFLFVGPSIGKRSYPKNLTLEKNNERPVMLISLGTIFNSSPEFYKKCIEAFRDSKWQVIMSIGTTIDPQTLGEIPNNFIVRQKVPQLKILSYSELFITHGGMNSTMEALNYGVPMVVIPQMPEQAITARRVTEKGLGQHFLPDEATIQRLQKSVQQVSEDKELKKRLNDMKQQIQEAGGVQKAVGEIEKLLEDTKRQTEDFVR